MKSKFITRIRKAKSISVGGPVADTEVHLCLYAHDIDLSAITSQLGVAPTQGVTKGEIVGRRLPAKIGLWSLQAPKDLPFEAKLLYLVDATTKKMAVWKTLAKTHKIQLRCAVYLHSWTEGFDLPNDLVAEIGRRCWQFSFSVYGAEGDEVLEALLSKDHRSKRKRPNQAMHHQPVAGKYES